MGAVDAILAAVSVPVQLGGGIRSAQSAIELLRLGVDRVVFGTAAIESPDEVRATIEQSDAESVIVGVDAKQGVIATRGWTRATQVRAASTSWPIWPASASGGSCTPTHRT